MSTPPDEAWGPIGGVVLRCLASADAPTPGASVSAATAVMIGLGALAVAVGITVYTRLRTNAGDAKR